MVKSDKQFFKDFSYYFYLKDLQRETDTERCSIHDSFPKWSQQPALSQSETRSFLQVSGVSKALGQTLLLSQAKGEARTKTGTHMVED